MASRRSKGSEKTPSVQVKDFSINLGKTSTSSSNSSNRTTPEADTETMDKDQRESSSGESTLQIDTGQNPQAGAEDNSDTDSLSDLPPEALKATSKVQFTAHMRHFVWLQYPSAHASEHNSIIVRKWKELVASRKAQSGSVTRRRSEVDHLGDGDEPDETEITGRRSSKRRAARNISHSAYTLDDELMDYVDSPASSAHSKDTGKSLRSRGKRKAQPLTRSKGKKTKVGPKVPPMKIKMIGRSGESDSPIFFAESVESWDEGSDSERGGVLRDDRVTKLKAQEVDSETSSIDFNEIEGGSALEEADEDEEEYKDEEMEVSGDSEGEHADYCFNCKDC